jgi:DNA-binding transcriptional MerR regulator
VPGTPGRQETLVATTERPGGLLGIRAVFEMTGLSIDTLRWYEREGLLPLVRRTSDRQRRYSPAAVNFVRLVQALRRTGMPVAHVRAFVQMENGVSAHGPRMAILERQQAAIIEQLQQLEDDLVVVREKPAHYQDLIVRGLDCEDEIGPG